MLYCELGDIVTTILNKINEKSGPPPPSILMMPKWRVFALCAFIIVLDEWRLIAPFYSVQDYPRSPLELQEAIRAMQITSDICCRAFDNQGKRT